MAVRITCPECDATLKLAKAPAPGKKVKCPKCEALFVPSSEKDAADDPDRPVKTAARKATGPKPKPKAAAVKPEAKHDDDDDDGRSTYAVIEEDKPKEEDDDDDDDKPEIEYGLDETVKDPRGPCQVRVNRPAGLLMMCGAAGFIGWLIVLVIAIIAVFLPVQNDPGKDEQGNRIQGQGIGAGVSAVAKTVDVTEPKMSDKEKELIADQKAASEAAKVNMIAWFTANVIIFLIMLGVAGLGMTWAFLVMVGGVKVANMESRAWGIVSSILVMFPVHTLGPIMLVTLLISVVFIKMLEDAGLAALFCSVLIPVICLANLAVGVYMLVTLLSEEVRAGFEYKPE
jgi:predicted Zn finger-like uncharacterized protein